MPDAHSAASAGLEPGLEASLTVQVVDDMTAARVGSGSVAVLATPEIVALAERAAVAALADRLTEGATTVGVSVQVDHLAPTPPGTDVTVSARLEAVEDRRLRFSFVVTDPAGDVARGSHVRIAVDRARFEAGARDRLAAPDGAEPGPRR